MEDLNKQQLIMLVFLVSFVTALFTGIVTVSLVQQAPQGITQTIQKVIERSASIENQPPAPLQKEETKELELGALSRDFLIGDIVNRISPAVVSVIATKDIPIIEQYFINPFSEDELFGNLFPDIKIPQFRENGTQKRQVSSGTGFFASSDGFLITNKHVVADKLAEYSVITNDGKTLSAKVIARDLLHDVAILRIDGNNFSFIPLGDSDGVRIGHTAIAIGNALGEFQNTVSIGVISGLKRNITASGGGGGVEELTDLIQTDAAINPGNSGGPLLNLKGEVIGLNTAVASGAENIGFALPVNQIKKGLGDARKFGKIIYPFFGVRYTMVENGAQLVRGSGGESAVVEGSPAYKTGLKEGDIIIKFGDKKVTKETPLAKLIQESQIGHPINITILRDGAEITLETTLVERKEI
ncbi:MAG: trypsin-like peptidase domain-containing protein [Patescibacteria group bacterium]